VDVEDDPAPGIGRHLSPRGGAGVDDPLVEEFVIGVEVPDDVADDVRPKGDRGHVREADEV
jgi:hypothetical protein